jgi:hypothetical protein
MFQQLQPLLNDRSFVLIVSELKDSRIQVQFVPKALKEDTAQDKPLLQPLLTPGSRKPSPTTAKPSRA